MQIPRVSDAKWKQLAELKGHHQSSNRARGGIMVIPRIANADEWDREAMEQQRLTLEDARADAVVTTESHQHPDPADRTPAYKDTASAPGIDVTPVPEPVEPVRLKADGTPQTPQRPPDRHIRRAADGPIRRTVNR